MNDFDGLISSDYGFKRQGKSAPMAASKGSSNTSRSARNINSVSGKFMDDGDSIFGSPGNQKNRDTAGFEDLFGGSARSPSKSASLRADSSINLDSMFHGSSDYRSKSMNAPVYDKPVYDDDIFDGVPGMKSSSKVKYDDVFASVSSAPAGGGGGGAFDDLLGGFGKKVEPESKSLGGKRTEKNDKSVPDFSDLIPGFGGSSPHSERYNTSVFIVTGILCE